MEKSIDFFATPPAKDVYKIIKEFKKTDRYNRAFLKQLERGLRESDYFTSCSTR